MNFNHLTCNFIRILFESYSNLIRLLLESYSDFTRILLDLTQILFGFYSKFYLAFTRILFE